MEPYTVYFAGELFSQKHLIGNSLLAKAIYDLSEGRLLPILPQDLEFRSNTPQDIRDQDLLGLIQCDLALFHFDGAELDSGTIVEFMTAKFADIPSVILRTDFRNGGDQPNGGEPWNLMCSAYPRTETVISSCLDTSAQSGHKRQTVENYDPELLENNLMAQSQAVAATAKLVIDAFDKVIQETPIITTGSHKAIYEQLQLFPGFNLPKKEVSSLIQKSLERKIAKKLI